MPRLPFGRGKEQHFADKGHALRGVIHVGMNDGEEIGWYIQAGRTPVLGFEPNPEVWAEACTNYAADIEAGVVRLVNVGLGAAATDETLKVVKGIGGVEDTKGASVLGVVPDSKAAKMGWLPQRDYREIPIKIRRFDDWVESSGWDLTPYNVLVVDVQGMELDVLKGFGGYLTDFPYLMVECSEVPLWPGEASAQLVTDWLTMRGYRRDSPIVSHNDVMFIREGA